MRPDARSASGCRAAATPSSSRDFYARQPFRHPCGTGPLCPVSCRLLRGDHHGGRDLGARRRDLEQVALGMGDIHAWLALG